ncbi:MAG: ribonuclease J [Acidimicrobiaceae bacterium]|nr:ribonuclease J [Acidimicrobiaceae bacterium]
MTDLVSITFLGGLGDIGRNCAAIESKNQILLLDCGQLFPDEMMPGAQSVLPDFSYLKDRSEKIVGCIATHGHEDHIGALRYALDISEFPIYGSEFTLGMIRHRLSEANMLHKTDLVAVADGETISIGDFRCEFLPVTHSTPKGLISAIRTPQGLILHSSDFKLDNNPVDGRVTDLDRIAALSKDPGIRLLLCDSTNAELSGFSISESEVGDGLEEIFMKFQHERIIATCFSSHIHRIQQIIDISKEQGRKVATLGFSMERNISLARSLGVISVSEDDLVDISEIETYPKNQICVISTGSQGEPRSSLNLSAQNSGKWLRIDENDVIIFSSRTIPGNEKRVARLVNNLVSLGASVVNDENLNTHTSGHGQREELSELHKAANPEWFIPVHGELRHLVAHRELAIEIGTNPKNALLATDGDQVVMEDSGLTVNRNKCQGHYIFSQGSIVETRHDLFKDRNILGKEGCVIARVSISEKDKTLIGAPSVISKGWLSADISERHEQEIEEQLSSELKTFLKNRKELTQEVLEQKVRRVTGSMVNDSTKRRPMIIPLVDILP